MVYVSQHDTLFPLSGIAFNTENILRAGFRTDTAGNTLAGDRVILSLNHYLERACFYAFTAFLTLFLANRINPCFVLRDSAGFAAFRAFSTLDAGNDLELSLFCCYMQTGQILLIDVCFFVKSSRTRVFTGKAIHTGVNIING
jgi:hypothetical protein